MKRYFIGAVLLATAMIGQAADIQLSWGSKDQHYAKNYKLAGRVTSDTTIQAWRGERVGALALVEVPAGKEQELKATLKGKLKGSASWINYVITDSYRQCGIHPDTLRPFEIPDIIDTQAKSLKTQGETRALWLTIEVPRDAKAGKYKEELQLGKKRLTLNIQVSKMTLPEPKDYSFMLDLWQQPYSVSRYAKVEPWSEAHFEKLKPYAQMLARAGQSTISAILFFEPWGEQSNDLFEPMVETIKMRDGSWTYDYTIFDKWVEFMDANGVDGLIECFTMIPWEMKFRYFDVAENKYKFLKTTTSTAEYRDLWSNFLRSFAEHLKEKGWFERTMISMDERQLKDMMNAYDIIQSVDPNFKISLAGNYHKQLEDKMYMYTITLGEAFPPASVAKRRERGEPTLLYTCCSRQEPNIFSNNLPADAVWLPLYCVAAGYDGYLHWSFMNWTDDPLKDSRFKLFAPGDTYFIYPDGRSSVRYERLVEGIEMTEKIKALQARFRKEKNVEASQRLDAALNPIRIGYVSSNVTTADQVGYLREVIESLSQK